MDKIKYGLLMIENNKQNVFFRIAFYVAMSILLTGILLSGLKRGYQWVFWVYIGVMGVSTLIVKWFDFSDKHIPLLDFLTHIVYVCAITMLFLFLSLRFFFPK